MHNHRFVRLLLGLGLVTHVLFGMGQPSQAQTKSFFCDRAKDPKTGRSVLATLYRDNPLKRPIPILPWRQNDFPGIPLEQRCRDVATRFERSYNDGTLQYIRTGTIRRYPVWCADPSRDGSPCPPDQVLVTFRPGTASKALLVRTFNLDTLRNVISTSGRDLDFEINGDIYVDFTELVTRFSVLEN